MHIQNRTTPAVSFAILSSILALAFMSADVRYVVGPGLACVVMVLWLWMTLWNRDKKIPFFDAGFFCALATLIYTVYPLFNYWVDGLQYGLFSDSRLQAYDIVPAELGLFHLRHVLYLFSFVVFYSVFRGRGTLVTGNVRTPTRSVQQAIILFFLILTGYFFLSGMLMGADYNPNGIPETYGDKIAIGLSFASKIPLLLLQISGKLAGILFVFKLALLFIVVCRCRQRRWLTVLLLWIAAEIIQTLVYKGGRTGLVLFLMATALYYHRMIKPFTMKHLITSGSLVFLLFIFMGSYRAYIDLASFQAHLSQSDAGIFSETNEFQALLGTAYDALQRKINGADLPWYLYINDIITILPPQQLMPFEKVSASEWYLRELGISGTGQGYMWGVITQSIVGLDWIELALRGGVLGLILAKLHRLYVRHQASFIATLLYVYLCLRVYYTFRDTTFSLLANLVWEISPFYLLLRIGVSILSGRKRAINRVTVSPCPSKI